jgi:hypothetical protein
VERRELVQPAKTAPTDCVAVLGDGCGAVLEVLNLAFNPLGEAGGQALAAMLEKNTTLRVLDLGNTDLGIKSLVRLASALAAHNRSLQYLSVESPLLTTVPPAPRSAAGCVPTRVDEALMCSAGGGGQVMEEGTLHFARALAANDALRCLRFGKHGVRDAGVETLVAYGLVSNNTLTSLDLRCNALSEVRGSARLSCLAVVRCSHTITIACPIPTRTRDSGPDWCALVHWRRWPGRPWRVCSWRTAHSPVRPRPPTPPGDCACLYSRLTHVAPLSLPVQRWCCRATGCGTAARRRWRRRCRTTRA